MLRRELGERLVREGVGLRLGTEVETLQDGVSGVVAGLSDGSEVTARYAFNITCAQINAVLDRAALPRTPLKYELTELALVPPPEELARMGVTVMDGPFFSCMPYPARDLYSLNHVRYTPHESWIDSSGQCDPYRQFTTRRPDT